MEKACPEGLKEWLVARGDALRAAWLEATLAFYPRVFRDFVRDRRDPLANPAGAILREGIDRAFALVVDGGDASLRREALEPMMRLKAAQAGPASEALAFVPRLKGIVLAEWRGEAEAGLSRNDIEQIDRRVDALLLTSFDLFLECREAIYQLRVNETKRSLARFRMGGGELRAEPADPRPVAVCSACAPGKGCGS